MGETVPKVTDRALPADIVGGHHLSLAFTLRPEPRSYLIGREPVMRMSTSLLALCFQSGLEATLETPIRARSRSNGSRSLRMSPLLIARFTRASIAPWT